MQRINRSRLVRHSREAIAFVGFVLLVLVLVNTMTLSRHTDNLILAQLVPAAEGKLHPGITLIDFPYDPKLEASGDPGGYRRQLARLLKNIAKQPQVPGTIILDIWFSSSQQQQNQLGDAIATLQLRGSTVLAAVNPVNRHGAVDPKFYTRHNRYLYDEVLDGYGHSLLELRQGLLSYQEAIDLPAEGPRSQRVIPALPILAANGVRYGTSSGRQVVFPWSAQASTDQISRLKLSDGISPDQVPATYPQQSHLVIGSFQADSDNALKVAGPVLLAFAISNRLSPPTAQPINSAIVSILLTALTALVSMAIFVAGFRKIKRSRPPSEWVSRSSSVCLVALAASCLLLVVVFMVAWSSKQVVPIANPIFASMATVGALWLLVKQRQADAISHIGMDETISESAIQYDVFISYAHEPIENLQWVKQALFHPLSQLEAKPGRPLRIFFDETSIRPGRQWKREIELALLGTKLFVPVYSDRYFERAYCREELEIADQLRIENRLMIVPVSRAHDVIPERYRRKVQYIDANNPDFLDQLVAQIPQVGMND